MTGPLCARVAELCDRAAALLPDGPQRDLAQRIESGLAEPLRVAVAGRISSGKSTLVNALLGQRVAPTDVSECTRYVTTYQYGVPERVEIVERSGARRREALLPDGSLPRAPAEGGGPLERLEVFLANDALRELVLIDTPGLGSLGANSGATAALLGLDGDSRTAVADADALVFVLTASLRGDEAELLHGVHDVLGGSTASPLSTMAVLNKADLMDDDGDDALQAAAELAGRFAHALRDVVSDLRPVISLLAETALTGRFTEGHAVALRALAALPDHERRAMVLSVDRFRDASSSLPRTDRVELLDAMGLHGVEVALQLIREGRSSAAELLTELRRRSGFDGVRDRLLRGYAGDADALKANGALAALERLVYAMTDSADADLRVDLHDGIDAVRTEPAMHRLSELAAANATASGEVALPEDLERELRRLVGETTPTARLGLPEDAGAADLQRAASAAASSWKRFRNDGRASPSQQWVADVMTKSCERLWLEAGQGSTPREVS